MPMPVIAQVCCKRIYPPSSHVMAPRYDTIKRSQKDAVMPKKAHKAAVFLSSIKPLLGALAISLGCLSLSVNAQEHDPARQWFINQDGHMVVFAKNNNNSFLQYIDDRGNIEKAYLRFIGDSCYRDGKRVLVDHTYQTLKVNGIYVNFHYKCVVIPGRSFILHSFMTDTELGFDYMTRQLHSKAEIEVDFHGEFLRFATRGFNTTLAEHKVKMKAL